MEFDLRATSPDMIAPVYTFPGDEAISPDEYRSVIYGGYVTTTATLYGAARAIGLPVDAETFERWKRISASAGLLDDFLDESPDPVESQQLYDRGLAEQSAGYFSVACPDWGDIRLVSAVHLMLTCVGSLPEARQQQLITAARNIGRIAIAKTTVDDLDTYIDILRQEADDTGNLIRLSASQDLYDQPRFEAFSGWCKQAMTLATLYDHARDLSADHRLGRTAIGPSLGNRLRLGVQAARPFAHLMRSYATRHASRAAIAARIRYSPQPTKRLFSRTVRDI